MKTEKIGVENEYLLADKRMEKKNNAFNYVNSIWEQFLKLQGTSKGIVVNFSDDRDGDRKWPSVKEYLALPIQQRRELAYEFRKRHSNVVREMKKRCHPLMKSEVYYSYVGNCCFFFGWRYKNPKKGEVKDENQERNDG